MTLSEDELIKVLLGELNESEREGAVIYLTVEPVSAGEVVNVPGLEIHIPWDAALAFVDREPMANWSHGSRYVLLSRQTGEVASIEARLPPFGAAAGRQWRVAWKPQSVPDRVLPKLG
jgi:hypothetical protein